MSAGHRTRSTPAQLEKDITMAPDASPADHELEDHEPADHELEDHDRGLSHDLPTLLNRRRALSIFGGAGLAAALAACGAGSTELAGLGATTTSAAPSGSRRRPPGPATPSPRRPAGPSPATAPTGSTC